MRRINRSWSEFPPNQSVGPFGAERLRFEEHVVEAIERSLEGCRRVAPQHGPGGEMLIEQRPPGPERDSERLVLGPMPAHRRLDDQAPLGQEIERRQVFGQQERVTQGRDDGAGHQPQPGGRRRDRGQQHERARPRGRGILVAGQGVVARVRGEAVGSGVGSEHHVLADHHGIEPGLFRLHREPDERAEIARGRQGPVLAEDQDELRWRHGCSVNGACRRPGRTEVRVPGRPRRRCPAPARGSRATRRRRACTDRRRVRRPPTRGA